jgi:4-coumarate--CoA ligase
MGASISTRPTPGMRNIFSSITLINKLTGRNSYEIPNLDLLTLLFESSWCGAKENTQVHVDAENPSKYLTKASARSLTKRIAHALRTEYNVGPIAHSKGTKGAKTKDYVTCISAGNYIVPTMFYGVVAAGGIFSSVTSSATVEELERLIKLAPSELIICGDESKDVTLAAAKKCGIPTKNILVIDVPNVALRRASDGKDILTKSELNWRKITNKKELENTPLCLIYSSGTTGLPKGVPLSHMNMVAECVLGCDPIKGQMDFEYKTIAHLPVAHIAGMQGYFVNPFYMGGPTYWMAKFDFPKFLEYNKKYGITFFFTVPPIYLLIAKMPQVTDQFDTIKVAISGAAPMGKDLQYAASAKLGKGETFITQTWGLSESTGSATLLGYGEKDDTGSVSRLLPNCIARYFVLR